MGVLTKPSSFISLDCAVMPCRERVVFSRGFLLRGSAQAESFFCKAPMRTLRVSPPPRTASLTHVHLAQSGIETAPEPRTRCMQLTVLTRHVAKWCDAREYTSAALRCHITMSPNKFTRSMYCGQGANWVHLHDSALG